MKPRLSLHLLALLFVIALLTTALPTQAQSQGSCWPPTPPLDAQSTAPTASVAQAGPASLNLPPLKAVLLVGPIDGNDGDWTVKERANMELAARELEANGVSVTRFYTPSNDWTAIREAARGAHFLLYRGHGVYWTPKPAPSVGGFSLNGGMVSPDDLRRELELAPNAIIMLYGCFTAGTSSSDSSSISSEEAQRRVAEYAAPFFETGAGGYYANWFGDAFQRYVRALFAGQTLGQAYEGFYDFNPTSVERYSYPANSDLAMWLDKDNWDGSGVKYNNAFIGKSNQTLESLFQTAAMELSQTELSVLITPTTSPTTRQITVAGTGGATFTWNANLSPALAWLQISTSSGNSGENLSISLNPSQLPPGDYSATINIISNTSQISGSNQSLTVKLMVREQIFTTYMPSVQR
jgi:hypothetical protein